MAGSTFGNQFKIMTWGESHGAGVGVVIDGCPSGIPLAESDIQLCLIKENRDSQNILHQEKKTMS